MLCGTRTAPIDDGTYDMPDGFQAADHAIEDPYEDPSQDALPAEPVRAAIAPAETEFEGFVNIDSGDAAGIDL